jgi:hypothetical protein
MKILVKTLGQAVLEPSAQVDPSTLLRGDPISYYLKCDGDTFFVKYPPGNQGTYEFVVLIAEVKADATQRKDFKSGQFYASKTTVFRVHEISSLGPKVKQALTKEDIKSFAESKA